MAEKRTDVASLGEFGLIEKLTSGFDLLHKTTVTGIGDDAAVLALGGDGAYTLLTTDLLLEGIHFDLTYFPLKHLGYKAVVVGIEDIYALNGTPRALTLALGVSSKMSVEALEQLYAGVRAACEEYDVDLVGGDTTPSLTGLTIGVSVVGEVAPERIVRRNGAQQNDLVCITGDVGAAYLGLHLLEREKRAFEGHPAPQPQFEGYEYLLGRQLHPHARRDIVEALAAEDIVPTSMIDLSDGLASDVLHICDRSACGVRIYLDRLPIAAESYRMAEELHIDPVVAALNGGDDHELLFTVPLALQERIMRLGGVEVIGHITPQTTGAYLVLPDGTETEIRRV